MFHFYRQKYYHHKMYQASGTCIQKIKKSVEILKASILSKNINLKNVHSYHPRRRLCLLFRYTSPTPYTCYKNEQGELKDFSLSNSGLMFLLTSIHLTPTKPKEFQLVPCTHSTLTPIPVLSHPLPFSTSYYCFLLLSQS